MIAKVNVLPPPSPPRPPVSVEWPEALKPGVYQNESRSRSIVVQMDGVNRKHVLLIQQGYVQGLRERFDPDEDERWFEAESGTVVSLDFIQE